jgi:hypothetical protein
VLLHRLLQSAGDAQPYDVDVTGVGEERKTTDAGI